jgi:hypothetical protein
VFRFIQRRVGDRPLPTRYDCHNNKQACYCHLHSCLPFCNVSSRPPSLHHNLNEVVVFLNTLRNVSIYYGCLLPLTMMDSLNPSITWVYENYAMDVNTSRLLRGRLQPKLAKQAYYRHPSLCRHLCICMRILALSDIHLLSSRVVRIRTLILSLYRLHMHRYRAYIIQMRHGIRIIIQQGIRIIDVPQNCTCRAALSRRPVLIHTSD